MYKINKNVLILSAGATIPPGYFSGRADIHEIVFKGPVNIGESAFYGCMKIRDLIIPRMSTIGAKAFSRCFGLINVTIREDVKVGAAAFNMCHSIEELDIQKKVKIGAAAFLACSSIQALIIKERVDIGVAAFRACAGIKSLRFFPGVRFDRWAFVSCGALKEVIFAENMTIRELAFLYCDNITSIRVPACINPERIKASFKRSTAMRRRVEYTREMLVFSLPNLNSVKGQRTISSKRYERQFISLVLLCFNKITTQVPIEMVLAMLSLVRDLHLGERTTTLGLTLLLKKEERVLATYGKTAELFRPFSLNRERIAREVVNNAKREEERFLDMYLPVRYGSSL